MTHGYLDDVKAGLVEIANSIEKMADVLERNMSLQLLEIALKYGLNNQNMKEFLQGVDQILKEIKNAPE